MSYKLKIIIEGEGSTSIYEEQIQVDLIDNLDSIIKTDAGMLPPCRAFVYAFWANIKIEEEAEQIEMAEKSKNRRKKSDGKKDDI